MPRARSRAQLGERTKLGKTKHTVGEKSIRRVKSNNALLDPPFFFAPPPASSAGKRRINNVYFSIPKIRKAPWMSLIFSGTKKLLKPRRSASRKRLSK